MTPILVAGRKLGLLFYTYVAMLPATGLYNGVSLWSQSWWSNRARILVYTAVNVAITTANEAAVRNITAPIIGRSYHQFLVKTSKGMTVNKQSLINIFMTLFASLLGGPVFFFKSRWGRFLFFIGFGTFNSAVSQFIVGMGFLGVAQVAMSRLFFDFCYNGSFKFVMFEFFRKPIIRSRYNVLKIGFFRYKQDFATTFLRVSLLNIFGFRGL